MRARRVLPSALAAWMALSAGSLWAQADSARAVSPEKAAAIRTLLEVTNTAEMFLHGFEEAAAAQPASEDLPEDFWDRFKAKVRTQVPQFLEMLIPLDGDTSPPSPRSPAKRCGWASAGR